MSQIADSPKSAFPPGPRDEGFGLLNGLRINRDILAFMSRLGTYGDLAHFRLGPIHAYLLNSPELLHGVFVRRAEQIRKLPHQTRVLSQIEGHGLLVSEGEAWRRQRQLLQPAFSTALMPRYAEITSEETIRHLARWTPGARIDVVAEMTDLAMRIMARSFFGLMIEDDIARLRNAVRDVSRAFLTEVRLLYRFPRNAPLPLARRKWAAIDTLDRLVRDMVRRAKDDEARGGFVLPLLMSKVADGGSGFSEEQARDEVVTFFNSGHDTTAAALVWLLELLARHPAVTDRMIAEIRSTCGAESPAYEHIARLPYSEAVIREAMRLYPPGWAMFTRKTLAPMQIDGFDVATGSWLLALPWVTHRDSRFFPDPLRFDPDRFSPERIDAMARGAYFPFGVGGHACIGQRLSMIQLILIAAILLSRYRPRPCPGMAASRPVALLSIWPRRGLQLVMDAV